MVAGMVPALILPLVFNKTLELYFFPVFFVTSLAGCLIGTLMTSPTDDKTLSSFYRTVRPWGFWKPIHDKVVAADPSFRKNTDFGRDMFNIVIGVIWQTALVLLPIYVVLMNWKNAGIVLGIVALTSAILKRNWYDRLSENS